MDIFNGIDYKKARFILRGTIGELARALDLKPRTIQRREARYTIPGEAAAAMHYMLWLGRLITPDEQDAMDVGTGHIVYTLRRRQARISQSDLASELRVSNMTVSRRERGLRDAPISREAVLAAEWVYMLVKSRRETTLAAFQAVRQSKPVYADL